LPIEAVFLRAVGDAVMRVENPRRPRRGAAAPTTERNDRERQRAARRRGCPRPPPQPPRPREARAGHPPRRAAPRLRRRPPGPHAVPRGRNPQRERGGPARRPGGSAAAAAPTPTFPFRAWGDHPTGRPRAASRGAHPRRAGGRWRRVSRRVRVHVRTRCDPARSPRGRSRPRTYRRAWARTHHWGPHGDPGRAPPQAVRGQGCAPKSRCRAHTVSLGVGAALSGRPHRRVGRQRRALRCAARRAPRGRRGWGGKGPRAGAVAAVTPVADASRRRRPPPPAACESAPLACRRGGRTRGARIRRAGARDGPTRPEGSPPWSGGRAHADSIHRRVHGAPVVCLADPRRCRGHAPSCVAAARPRRAAAARRRPPVPRRPWARANIRFSDGDGVGSPWRTSPSSSRRGAGGVRSRWERASEPLGRGWLIGRGMMTRVVPTIGSHRPGRLDYLQCWRRISAPR